MIHDDIDRQRMAVAAEARSWLGTNYHHHGRVKGAGVDCAMLLAEVFERCGIVPPVEIGAGDYPHDWHLHESRELFEEQALRYAAPLDDGLRPQVGDFGLWRYGRARSHAGLVVEVEPRSLLIVHAYIGAGVIKSRDTEAPLAGHRVRWYSPWAAAGAIV